MTCTAIFLAEEIDNELVGGVSLLSGYVNQVRRDTPNTLYMIAGDMFRGSLIDTEFKGISTIEIMNVLGPDIVSLGNHELDYGIAHLLFLERCCKFPIVNANIYIRPTGMRLFQSHRILHVDGMKILVMGLLTEDIMSKAKSDMLLGTFVDLSDAAREVGIICNSYKNVDIDFTILLTHIGFAEDLKLAEQLDPKWGVDVIIGGHSHTYLDEPAEVNNILIVQAGIGTDQIGRFEIEVNTDTNSVDSYTWETVPIDDAHCEKNERTGTPHLDFKRVTDEKIRGDPHQHGEKGDTSQPLSVNKRRQSVLRCIENAVRTGYCHAWLRKPACGGNRADHHRRGSAQHVSL